MTETIPNTEHNCITCCYFYQWESGWDCLFKPDFELDEQHCPDCDGCMRWVESGEEHDNEV